MKFSTKVLLVAVAVFWVVHGAAGQSCPPAAPFNVSIDLPTKAAVLDSVFVFTKDRYVYPDETDEIIEEIAERFKAGDYDAFRNTDAFAKALTQDLRSVSNDLHFTVIIRPPGSREDLCSAVSDNVLALKTINYGFTTVRIMPGNVGYLELTACTDATLGGATASAAMKFLAGVDALIIDLRSNGGGLTSMGLYLSSYLFEPRKLMHSLARRDSKDLEHFRTAVHVEGERLLDIPVYVLTSSRTASSAECFAYDLKHHGRATVVGERTAGAGHCAERGRFEFGHFQLDVIVPVYQPVHPVTRTNWEGTGVAPDIAAKSDESLDIAYQHALRSAGSTLSGPESDGCRPAEDACSPSSFAPAKSESCRPSSSCGPGADGAQQASEVAPKAACGGESPFSTAIPSRRGSEPMSPVSPGGSVGESAVFEDVLSLYELYDIVHIGERHWNLTDYSFRVALINHPSFADVVDDIVIESGNYLYQDLLDEYILDLEDVPEDQLCKVWRDTVLPTGVWDATIYKNFVHDVRAVNERLPRDQRVRLIAAEPPIDWSKVKTPEQAARFFGQRCTHASRVVETEVLKYNRKALIIYGGAHFYRSSNVVPVPGRMRANLEQRMGGRLFTILPLGGDDKYSRSYQTHANPQTLPSFVCVNVSVLASLPGDLFFEEADGPLGGFTDGILFFGKRPDSVAVYDPSAANDVAYQEELKRRRLIFRAIQSCGPPSGAQ
jgi:hypothetical protein